MDNLSLIKSTYEGGPADECSRRSFVDHWQWQSYPF